MNNNNNNKEIQLLYIQVFGSIIFIVTIIVSIILTYNTILEKQGKPKLFNDITANNITLNNRIVLTILTIVFTYINYEFYKINKQKKEDFLQKEELLASILTLIAGFLLLHSTVSSINSNNQTTNENTPII